MIRISDRCSCRISSEIEVTYIKEEKVIAKVLYPEYSEVYDEIAPAHIFGRNIEGEGFRARQCFDGGKADMNQYDTIFPKASAEESVKVAGKIALYRLMYPYMLGSSSEVLYMDYLKNNKNEIIGSCIYDKNIDERTHFVANKGWKRISHCFYHVYGKS